MVSIELPRTAAVTGGLIAGNYLMLLRKSRSLTQEKLADKVELDVDIKTLQGFEEGLRPIMRSGFSKILPLLDALDATDEERKNMIRAIEADKVLWALLNQRINNDLSYPTLSKFLRRETGEFLRWALTGVPPQSTSLFLRVQKNSFQNSKRGLQLSKPEINIVCQSLIDLGTITARRQDPRSITVKQQSYYYLGRLQNDDANQWLSEEFSRQLKKENIRTSKVWDPTFISTRSLVITEALHGDLELLSYWIDKVMQDQRADAANLNYMAFWAGAADSGQADIFDRTTIGRWRVEDVVVWLLHDMNVSPRLVDLNVHSLSVLFRTSEGRQAIERSPYLSSEINNWLEKLMSTSILTNCSKMTRTQKELNELCAKFK